MATSKKPAKPKPEPVPPFGTLEDKALVIVAVGTRLPVPCNVFTSDQGARVSSAIIVCG